MGDSADDGGGNSNSLPFGPGNLCTTSYLQQTSQNADGQFKVMTHLFLPFELENYVSELIWKHALLKTPSVYVMTPECSVTSQKRNKHEDTDGCVRLCTC
uniref:AlNc14C41G3491 protein n=1 Tax=Albugo laibachii Nc14 TaxID=890382 RepID=F0W9N6_9STRA|nr:AlNc14C41G3491 [Albugo laibachii Nc14]|eukprot:CCA17854.1 AlNc14C41G3491 [Albugo laibachii Nc14]